MPPFYFSMFFFKEHAMICLIVRLLEPDSCSVAILMMDCGTADGLVASAVGFAFN